MFNSFQISWPFFILLYAPKPEIKISNLSSMYGTLHSAFSFLNFATHNRFFGFSFSLQWNWYVRFCPDLTNILNLDKDEIYLEKVVFLEFHINQFFFMKIDFYYPKTQVSIMFQNLDCIYKLDFTIKCVSLLHLLSHIKLFFKSFFNLQYT